MNINKAYQYDQDGTYLTSWNSATEAANYFGIDESSIRKAAKKKKKSKGYYWSKNRVNNFLTEKYTKRLGDHLERNKESLKFPKVLVFDIETTPLRASIWQLKTEYVHTSMLDVSNWWILSWSAKWLFEDETMHDVTTPEEAIEEDDSRVIQSIWDLINEADIVISHNGINFDHKLLNMRWLLAGMMPPANYRVIDTLRSTKSLFRFPSYKLDFLSQQLGFGGKYKHEGFEMWKKCLKGDQEALQAMIYYNDIDVKILEELYLTIRPWIRNHPNMGIFIESEVPVCRVCGSSNLMPLPGHDYTTNLSKYETLRCECGAVNKRRKSKLPLATRKVLMSGMPA